MSVPRFYYPPPLPSGARCELPPEAAHHASRVLRLRVGDAVQIFDGQGNALDATLHAVEGKRVLLGNLQTCMPAADSNLRIVLAQALCGSEKMDWVIQKATELGAAEIIPLQTQRSVARLAASRADKRARHWHNVAVATCEQCGRNDLPLLQPPQDVGDWLHGTRNGGEGKFILLPGGAGGLSARPRPQGEVTLLVGPEGGFTADEANLAQQCGFVSILLGPRVLRTETAALAGIAALQTLWGDFN